MWLRYAKSCSMKFIESTSSFPFSIFTQIHRSSFLSHLFFPIEYQAKNKALFCIYKSLVDESFPSYDKDFSMLENM